MFDENYTTTDEIRKRVLKASKELDYRPRKNRKTYRDGKTVAIIYKEFINSFNNYITRGVSNDWSGMVTGWLCSMTMRLLRRMIKM